MNGTGWCGPHPLGSKIFLRLQVHLWIHSVQALLSLIGFLMTLYRLNLGVLVVDILVVV
jgi:hypothetical protein